MARVAAADRHGVIGAATRYGGSERSRGPLPGALHAVLCAAACLVSLLGVTTAVAQELEPRAYTNLPIGLNFLVAAYGYSSGDVVTDASVPLQDGEVEVHGTVLAYARSIAIRGRSAKFDMIVPYGWAEGSATVGGERRERNVEGLGDPRIRLSMNLYGAPALSLAEFAEYEQDLVVGASLQLGMPLGQYDSDKLLNLGTNRWSVRPQFGLSKTWHPVTVELSTGLALYSDNHDYLGGHTLRQEPVHSVQLYALYSIAHGFWGSLDCTYYGGGETTVDSAPASERLENTRVGATLGLPLSRYQSLKISASTGATARTGSDFDSFSVSWQLRWGAGL